MNSHQTWQYETPNSAFEFSNGGTSGSAATAPSSSVSSSSSSASSAYHQNDGAYNSFNYNPFLTLPSSSGTATSQQFKSDGYFQSQVGLQTAHSPFVNRGEQTNAVREYHLYKGTQGSALDSTKDLTFSRGSSGQLQPESYVPLYLSSSSGGSSSSSGGLHSKHKKPDAVENFSYFHIGGGGSDGQQQQQQQHDGRSLLSSVVKKEPSIYFIHKPKPVLGSVGNINGATPKTQIIQVSTVGGFFNNNPTTDPYNTVAFKKSKPRLNDDFFGAHKPAPIVKSVTPVFGSSFNKDFYVYNEQSSEFLPVSGTTPKANKYPLSSGHKHSAVIKSGVHSGVGKVNAVHQPVFNYPPVELSTTPKTGFFITRTEARVPITTTTTTKAPVTVAVTVPTPATQSPLPSSYWSAANKSNAVRPNKAISAGFNKFLSNLAQSPIQPPQRHPKNFPANAFTPNAALPTFSAVLKGSSWSGQKNTVNVNEHKAPKPAATTTSTTTTTTTTTMRTTTDSSDEYYYDDDDEDNWDDDTVTTEPNEVQTSGRVKSIAPQRNPRPTVVTRLVTTPPSYHNRFSTPAPSKTTLRPKITTTTSSEDDYYYYDDVWTHTYPQLPQNKSQYMPMSETAAPRPRAPTTQPTLSSSGKYNAKYASYLTSSVPPIIKFPEDIFHELRPSHIPRYLNHSTMRPYTVRTRLRPTSTLIGEVVVTTSAPPLRVHAASTTQRMFTTTAASTTMRQRLSPSKTPKKLDGAWEYDERHANRFGLITHFTIDRTICFFFLDQILDPTRPYMTI